MNKAAILAMMFLIFLLAGTVAQSLGVTTPLFANVAQPNIPQGTSGLNAIGTFINVIFNIIGSYFQMMIFHISGNPQPPTLVTVFIGAFADIYFGTFVYVLLRQG